MFVFTIIGAAKTGKPIHYLYEGSPSDRHALEEVNPTIGKKY